MTVNVEYNQLDPLLRSAAGGKGDENDTETGYSPYPGNINQLIFALEPYLKVLEQTKGVLEEFVNPKYADEARSTFKVRCTICS
jgi:UDP-sugar pyrophosphorylase